MGLLGVCAFLFLREHLTSHLQGYCAQILDDSLEVVALNCPKLMRLDVCFCLQVRDPGVMSVAESCHELRVVLLNGCEGLTDSSLMSLLDNCPHLSHATVCRTRYRSAR
jgi:F-box and leucine-rich repeat protein GRR1